MFPRAHFAWSTAGLLLLLCACDNRPEKRYPPAFSPEALQAYTEKASQGDPESEYMLGLIEQQGLGVPVNLGKAVEWFRRAAEQNHGLSQTLLGNLYQNGDGVPQDYSEAAKWYQRAASNGMTHAQFYLAQLYQNGQGVKQDRVQALKWLNLAAAGTPYVKEASIEIRAVSATLTPEQVAEAKQLADQFLSRTTTPPASPKP